MKHKQQKSKLFTRTRFVQDRYREGSKHEKSVMFYLMSPLLYPCLYLFKCSIWIYQQILAMKKPLV